MPVKQQASSRENRVEQESLVHFYTKGTRSGIGSCRSFADWMRHEAHVLGGGKSEVNIFSLWGRMGDRLYCSGGPETH